MSVREAKPETLQQTLDAAQPGDEIALRSGEYPGIYTIRTNRLTIQPGDGENPIFTGPTKSDNTKPAWLKLDGANITLRALTLAREGDIQKAKRYNDFGVIITGNDATLDHCTLYGMTKGVHIKGKCLRPTVVHSHIGPTYQSCIVVGTSYGVIRGALIAWNSLIKSWREDAVQFMQDFDSADTATDISNLGTILYQNQVDGCNENAFDLKGAGLVVIDGNICRRIGGSNDGPYAGWNHNANATFSRGKNTATGRTLIRNNDIQNCCSGSRMFPGWTLIHNLIANNNYNPDPAGGEWAGYGIAGRDGVKGVAAKNNLVHGHKSADLEFLGGAVEVENNPQRPGSGVPVTEVVMNGSGRTLPLRNASYFTDWFGRRELPPDVLYLRDERFEVVSVDYVANTVRLDHDGIWRGGDPVCWRSPNPVAGIQELEIVEPPTDPPVIVVPPALTEARVRAIAREEIRLAVERILAL